MKSRKPKEQVEASSRTTVQEAGRRGGCTTRDHYTGTDFYQKIGRRGGKKTAELYHDLLAEFGRRGGRPRRPNLENGVGEEFPEKEGGEVRSAPESPSPA